MSEKFAPGDEFEIRVRLREINNDHSWECCVAENQHDRFILLNTTLEAAKCVERPIKVGDRVGLRDYSNPLIVFTVLSINGKYVWCKDDDNFYRTFDAAELRRA